LNFHKSILHRARTEGNFPRAREPDNLFAVMSFSPLDSRILGPLFVPDAMVAVFGDDALLAGMLRAEAALAKCQARLGLVPPSLATAIEAIAPAAFDKAALGAATALAGVPTIPFVKALQKLLPADLEPHLHLGATSQDILDTGLALQMTVAFDLLAADLADLLAALARRARRHADMPCIARTYGQHAAPISFGFKVAVWLDGICDAAAELEHRREIACRAQLGGPVGTLAAFGDKGPALLADFAAELGLGVPTIAWHASRANLVGTAQWLAVLAGTCAKMAGDVVALASSEVGEASEPHVPGRGGSSAMPHKRNPIAAVAILANAQAAAGLAAGLSGSLVAAHERPAGAWHAEWHAIASLFGCAAGALAHARALAEGLSIDPAAMARNVELTRGLVYADAAAAALAPTLGRSAAHACVEAAADSVRRTGTTLQHALAASQTALSSAELAAIFDPSAAVAAAARWVEPVARRADALAARLCVRA
jgi:3-carboxy-cis,cis-muconate cycloisomerase